jgi:nucleotide-binding universal stress UspA family protein
VPIDFSAESTRALKHATVLAKQSGAAVTLLHVVEPIHCVCDFGYGPVTREEPNNAIMKSVRTHLRQLANRHLGSQQPWDAVVRSGVAFTEITKAAKELRIDLILMPTRGLTNSKDVSLGSTAERVVRHAPCPVLTLRKPSL